MYAFEKEFDLDDDVMGFEQDAFEDAGILFDDDFGYDLELELGSDLDDLVEPTPEFGILPKNEPYNLGSDFHLEGAESGARVIMHENARVNPKSCLNMADPDDLIVSDDEELFHISNLGTQAIVQSLDGQPVNSSTPHSTTQAFRWEQKEELNIIIDLDDDLYSEFGDEKEGLGPEPETEFWGFTMGSEHEMESTDVGFMDCDEEKEVKYKRYGGHEEEEHKKSVNDDDDRPSFSDPSQAESNSEEEEQEEMETFVHFILNASHPHNFDIQNCRICGQSMHRKHGHFLPHPTRLPKRRRKVGIRPQCSESLRRRRP